MLRREGDIHIPSGCAISAIMDRSGTRHDGTDIIKSIALMHDRGNGLGGGFAAYGIYPEYKELYAFHIFLEDKQARLEVQSYIEEKFKLEVSEKLPIRKVPTIKDAPLIWRFFVAPKPDHVKDEADGDEEQYVMNCVMHINTHIRGAFVSSSGKDMGAFKGVGYPEEMGEFYRLEDYKAWLWTAHGRFPTNTPGWWGGAHPFTLLDYSVVHNGEISSYDANRRFIEMFGYKCTLQTDTEVITYIMDYLVRVQGLTLKEAASVIAAPFWSTIAGKEDPEERKRYTYLRTVFPSLLITGPFSIVLGFNGGLMALNDRLKLRSMVVGEKDDRVFVASEEAAIRVMEPDAENIWAPTGGEPVIVQVKEGAY